MLWCWVLELIQSSRSVCNDWKIVEKPFVNKNASFSCIFRCIERLRDLHIASGNFTEAGYTVLEHAKLLKVLLLLIFNFFFASLSERSPRMLPCEMVGIHVHHGSFSFVFELNQIGLDWSSQSHIISANLKNISFRLFISGLICEWMIPLTLWPNFNWRKSYI